MIVNSIADIFTRIRNALSSRHKTVNIPYSRFIERITHILFQIGYIHSAKIYQNKKKSILQLY